MTGTGLAGLGPRRSIRRALVLVAVLGLILSTVGPAPAGAGPHADSGRVFEGGPPVTGLVADGLEAECEWEGLDDRCETWEADGAPIGSWWFSRMAVSPTGDRIFTWQSRLNSTMAAHDAATGEKLWEAKLAGITRGSVPVNDVAVSPDGKRVYAVGEDVAAEALHPHDRDVIVAAHDAATGTELWHVTLGLSAIDENDRYVSRERAFAVAASPDGRRVYLAGETQLFDRILDGCPPGNSPCPVNNTNVLIASYAAATGAREWVTTWGDKFTRNRGTLITVSPDSRDVFVGGTCTCGGDVDFLALGVRAHRPGAPAQEGSVLWQAIYDGYGPGEPRSMEVAPDGRRLYLTGWSSGLTAWAGDLDWATVAYQTGTGEELWVARYDGPADDRVGPLNRKFPAGTHFPSQLAVDPRGDTVFVTGTFEAFMLLGDGGRSPELRVNHQATLAYEAASGDVIWEAYSPTLLRGAAEPLLGPGHASPGTEGRSVDVSPDGESVYVLGTTFEASGFSPFDGQTTVSLDTATGARQWVARPAGFDLDAARVTAGSDGALVYALSANGIIRAYDAHP